MIERSTSGSVPQAVFFSFCVVTAFSGIYEVFEWLLTVVMAQHDADAYNGQQGDVWDAQKDIGIAMIGSVIAMPFVTFIRLRNKTS
jgi:putative membrane protein